MWNDAAQYNYGRGWEIGLDYSASPWGASTDYSQLPQYQTSMGTNPDTTWTATTYNTETGTKVPPTVVSLG